MDTVPLTEAKRNLSELLDRVEGEHSRLVITRHGHRAAILINEDDLLSLEETIEILSDEDLTGSVRRSRKESAKNKRSHLKRPT